MRKVTRPQLVKNILEYWDGMYGPFPRMSQNSIMDDYWFKKEHKGADGVLRSKCDIWIDLQKLDLNAATSEEVENIIGKGNLVRIFCTECGNEVKEAMAFDADENDIFLCKECLLKAYSNI